MINQGHTFKAINIELARRDWSWRYLAARAKVSKQALVYHRRRPVAMAPKMLVRILRVFPDKATRERIKAAYIQDIDAMVS